MAATFDMDNIYARYFWCIESILFGTEGQGNKTIKLSTKIRRNYEKLLVFKNLDS
jgi:hypothetical protein